MQNRLVLFRSLAVFASVAAAISCSSSDHSSTANGTLPPVPAFVQAVPTYARVTVSWEPNALQISNNVYWSATAGVVPGGAGVTKVTKAANPFIHDGRTVGSTYYYVVTGVNVNGESAPSAEVQATVAATLKSSPPDQVSASPGPMVDTIIWSAAPGATSYDIYWSSTAGINVDSAPSYAYKIINARTPYVHDILANASTYYYVVSSVNANGEGLPSTEVSTTPFPQAATPVATVTAGNKSDTLNWGGLAKATSYNVYRGHATGITQANADTVFSVGTSAIDTLTNIATFVDTALTNATTYYYLVTSVRNGVESAPTAQLSATPNAPFAAPTAVAASQAIASSAITWTNSAGATGYNIYRSTTSVFKPKHGVGGNQVATNVASGHIDAPLTNGTTYFYLVTSLGGGVESGPSTPAASATPNMTPVAPTTLTATAGSASDTLNWSAVGNAASYNVYFGAATGVTPGTGTKIAGVTSPYVHTGLTNGTKVFYIVTALNSAGESPASPEASATPNAPPAKPAGVTGTLGNGQAVIAWTNVAANTYNLYWDSIPGVTVARAIAKGNKIANVATPYTHVGRTNGKTYYYVVTANANGVESVISTEVSVTPLTPPPGVTATAGALGSKQITIAWTAQTGAASFNVYYATTAGVVPGGTGVTKITGAANPYLLGGLTTGTTYYFVVTAVNNSGETATSTEVSTAAP